MRFLKPKHYLLMKKILVLFSLCALISCQKEDKNATTTPSCLLKEVILFGGEEANDFYSVINENEKIKEIRSVDYTDKLYYTSNGNLIKKEQFENSVARPYITEYKYDANNNLIEVWEYDHSSNNQAIEQKEIYEYTNGKISKITYKDLINASPDYSMSLIWIGDNLTSITSQEQGMPACTYTYTYDLTKNNTIKEDFAFYYWQDPSDDYETIREALFFSKNQLVKAVRQCNGQETFDITYSYNSNNKIKDVLIDGDKGWTFRYTCD